MKFVPGLYRLNRLFHNSGLVPKNNLDVRSNISVNIVSNLDATSEDVHKSLPLEILGKLTET